MHNRRKVALQLEKQLLYWTFPARIDKILLDSLISDVSKIRQPGNQVKVIPRISRSLPPSPLNLIE